MGVSNRFWIAPMSYFRLPLFPGSAPHLIPSQSWGRYTDKTSAFLSEGLNAVILAPSFTFRDMALADATIVDGNWSTATMRPVGALYWMVDAEPDNISDLYYNYAMPADPTLQLCLEKATTAENQTQPRAWQFYFGNGYMIEWGEPLDTTYDGNPRLYKDGVLIDTRELKENERDGFWFSPHLLWQIFSFNGDMHISCSELSDTWVIHDIGSIPAAPWRIRSVGNQFAVNVSPMSFATSGSFKTPTISHYWPYDDGDCTSTCFPTIQLTGCSVTITPENVGTGTTGTKKTYLVELAGDGWHTPFVQALQPVYEPSFSASSATWQEITEFVRDATCRAEGHLSPQEMTVNFVNPDGALFARLDELGSWASAGQMVFRAQVKIDNTTYELMAGVLQTRNWAESRHSETLTAIVRDGLALVGANELLFAPCLTGYQADNAVKAILTWAGVPGDAITIETPTANLLDDPGRDYTAPRWLPANGTRVLELLRQICDQYGIRILYKNIGGNVSLAITRRDDTVVADYTTAAGESPSISMSALTYNRDLSGVTNVLLLEGRDAAGNPIAALDRDWKSIGQPGTDRYTGFLTNKYQRVDDISKQGSLNLAARWQMDTRQEGLARTTLTSRTSLHDRNPDEVITVSDEATGMDQKLFRILSVERRLTRGSIETSVETEEIL